ncbi:hypothetical protein N658DRAFT_493362 [Parathielavia hyrcaniae]|uniref:Uncharacterized protein n=1 Tax=Parathielavia hyrcaniae TaxID=113614 RepID=A0AAN6Q5G1_9PEZI|nr:hypothetical protein N658DRAFT_493362 [Parathielavia hyrcaniae]
MSQGFTTPKPNGSASAPSAADHNRNTAQPPGPHPVAPSPPFLPRRAPAIRATTPADLLLFPTTTHDDTTATALPLPSFQEFLAQLSTTPDPPPPPPTLAWWPALRVPREGEVLPPPPIISMAQGQAYSVGGHNNNNYALPRALEISVMRYEERMERELWPSSLPRTCPPLRRGPLPLPVDQRRRGVVGGGGLWIAGPGCGDVPGRQAVGEGEGGEDKGEGDGEDAEGEEGGGREATRWGKTEGQGGGGGGG